MIEINGTNYYTVNEIADKMNITKTGVRSLITRHMLPAEKFNRQYFITEKAFTAMIKKREERNAQ